MVDTRSSGGRAQSGVEVRLLSAAPQGCEMHSQSTVAQALTLRQEGLGARRIAKRLSVPVSTVSDWLAGNLEHDPNALVELALALRRLHSQHSDLTVSARAVALKDLDDRCLAPPRLGPADRTPHPAQLRS